MRGTLPADVVRWALGGTATETLPTDQPEILRFMAGVGWRVEKQWRRQRAALMVEEARATFGVNMRTAQALAREAHDVDLQSRLEELVVPRLAAGELDSLVRVTGTLGPGLMVLPRMGNWLMAVAAVAWRHPGTVVMAGQVNPSGWVRKVLFREREKEEARLPVMWERDAGALSEHLRAGRLVMCRLEDRGWTSYRREKFLGRVAMLARDPWDAARHAGVPVWPTEIHREHDKSWALRVGSATDANLRTYVREWAEPALRATPGQYLPWLAACREREAGLFL